MRDLHRPRRGVEEGGMEPTGGCLCVGCLEKRLGRSLRPKDFPRRDEFNILPGTKRLIERRGTRGVLPSVTMGVERSDADY